jgi:hypothetical protein
VRALERESFGRGCAEYAARGAGDERHFSGANAPKRRGAPATSLVTRNGCAVTADAGGAGTERPARALRAFVHEHGVGGGALAANFFGEGARNPIEPGAGRRRARASAAGRPTTITRPDRATRPIDAWKKS